MAKKKAKATHKKPQVLFAYKLVLNQWPVVALQRKALRGTGRTPTR